MPNSLPKYFWVFWFHNNLIWTLFLYLVTSSGIHVFEKCSAKIESRARAVYQGRNNKDNTQIMKCPWEERDIEQRNTEIKT